MKRLTFSLVCLAFLASVSPALQAGSPPATKPESNTKADARYTKELLTILQETHSVDAFVVALDLLLDMDCNARTVIPVVIRNAERLGILSNTLLHDDEDQDDNRAIAIVSEAIKMLQDRVRPNRDAAKEPKSEKKAKTEEAPVVPAQVSNSNFYDLSDVISSCPLILCNPVLAKSSIEFGSGQGAFSECLPPLLEWCMFRRTNEPTDAEVLQALPHLRYKENIAEEKRQHLRISKEQLVESVGPIAPDPVFGFAEVHHYHWKCTVNYEIWGPEGVAGACGDSRFCGSGPFGSPYAEIWPHADVVYIDKDFVRPISEYELFMGRKDDGRVPLRYGTCVSR